MINFRVFFCQVDLERALKLADGKEKDGLYVMPVLVCLNQVNTKCEGKLKLFLKFISKKS